MPLECSLKIELAKRKSKVGREQGIEKGSKSGESEEKVEREQEGEPARE